MNIDNLREELKFCIEMAEQKYDSEESRTRDLMFQMRRLLDKYEE